MMEILSTGEKIKRARIYKGLTLREICGNKVSVSKMSCIENNKVKAEDWILEYVAELLDIDVNYLKSDISHQLEENINKLKKDMNKEDIEEKLEYNLKYAEEYGYKDIAFKIIHMMYNYYIDKGQMEKLQSISSKYYDLYEKTTLPQNRVIYYMDLGRYLFNSGEYEQAVNYYNNARKMGKEAGDKTILAKITYNEAASHIMLYQYDKAYEVAIKLEDMIDYVEGQTRGEFYHMLAILSLRMDKGRFEEYENKSYEAYSDNTIEKSMAIYNYGVIMFDIGLREKAIEYIKESLRVYPTEPKEERVSYLIIVIDELLENNVLSLAQEVCNEALNNAISLDNIKFIERAYYYKAMILQKENNLNTAEMYMNLSLDALMKFGSKQDIGKRYMEMGYMYYKLENTSESIKYFNLALTLEKKV